jgi:tRNA-2-methylthio-N6-dimethylallyladenosine synthase
LPRLVATAEDGDKGINVFLSREETYSEISPVRLDSNGVSAFVTIMRGCDNMCSFCVVPFTRGRERSRDVFSILAECTDLFQKGYREVTLLGQNVDSYKWTNPENGELVDFADLLAMVAAVSPDLRVRFSTSHPKDITQKVIETMRDHENICKYLHLPVQSGSSRILKKMNRTYDKAWYMAQVEMIYKLVPDMAISADIISGFCTETEEDHLETLDIMRFTNYCMSYMFFYSERPGTLAARKYPDDVPMEVKKRRLEEIIQLQNSLSLEHNKPDVNKVFKVLVEKESKKSADDLCGRNSQNKMVVFPRKDAKIGDYVWVKINSCSQGTLVGELVPQP